VLKLGRNQLNSFTAELGCLTGLEELDASHNQLTRLPPTFTQLKGLQVKGALTGGGGRGVTWQLSERLPCGSCMLRELQLPIVFTTHWRE
jgi:hypothetical protein